ncbi:hypothetical protein K280104A7_32290 [Candidatus Bariatricus faecipullorum]
MTEVISPDKEPVKKWITVTEMGNLLGLKKTDRYWLVHKNVFETKELLGKMRVNIASFEKWYANQVKYHKVTGEEPGSELKEWSYSIRDIARILSIEESVVYDLLIRENIETVTVDYWKRVPKSAFHQWYKGQSRYLTQEDRKAVEDLYKTTISMPEMARSLGVTRSTVYSILKNKKYSHFFEMIMIGEQKRITKDSFLNFLNGQNQYHLATSKDQKDIKKEKNRPLADFRKKKLWKTGEGRSNGNQNYLTPDEAAFLAAVSRTTIINWYQMEYFPVVFLGNRVFIKRKEFESWIKHRKGAGTYGIHQRT